jgi:septal ring factor EnvC (AmiA/AmiB activator)
MYLDTPSSSSRSHALSIPDQIRALEKLAQIDAELKELEDQLTQERSTLDGLKSGIAKLDDKLATTAPPSPPWTRLAASSFKTCAT